MTRIIRTFLTASCLWVALAVASVAQSGQGIDYSAWEALAATVEQATAAEELSTADFEDLRAQVADWRARLLTAENANAARIATLESQIEALGPPPAEGESEPQGVAERRSVLNAQLAEAEAPRVAASEAYNRADGLIQEIDTIIRERSTQALFQADPPPINPLNWGAGVTSAVAVLTEIRREVRVRTQFDLRREEIRDGLPVTIMLALLALVLLTRGRSWTTRMTEYVARRFQTRWRETLAFFVSFTQLMLPFLGLFLLGAAVESTGILGPLGSALMYDGIGIVALIFLSMWLAGRLFPDVTEDTGAEGATPAEARRPVRTLIVAIGAMVGVTRFVQTFAAFAEVEPAARGVLLLPVYVILSYLFFRMARALSGLRRALADDAETPGFQARLLQFLVPALRFVAVVGPLLAVAGYLNAAERLMVPAALTLGFLGILQALQVPIRDTYAAITRTSAEDAGQALIPVLFNFLLAFAALPVIALIWGVRPAELGEIYARLSEGFSLGEARITPGAILSIGVVFAIGYGATRLLQGALKTTVLPRTQLDTGARNALTAGVGYVGIALAALLAINAGGIDLTALAFVLSALSVGIGFGLQNVVSNFVSGIILLIERPISEGDWIEVNGQMGIVKDISVRSTRIETFDKTDVIVPNADFISGTVTNWTRGNNIGRAVLTVGVAYGTDTRRVEAILLEIARGHPGVASYPEPGVDFLGFGADSLDFRIRAILRDVNTLVTTKTEINHQIAERFAAEGIEIPFAQRDIWLRNPETLRAPPQPSTPPADPEPTS